MKIAKPTGRFRASQGLPGDTKVDLNKSTYFMYEFIELFVGGTIVEGGDIPPGNRVIFPKLYKANETDFSHNGLGLLTGTISAVATEELNGMFELNVEYDSEGFLADVIDEEMIIKAKANDKQDEQLFRIYSITKNHENDNYIIDAQHITYDLANDFVEELIATDATKRQVMEDILARSVGDSKDKFTMTSPNNSTRSSTSLYRTNPLQMVAGMEGSVLQIWGGQIERDNYRLVLHDRRGSDDGVLVTYKKNLTGLEAKFDMSKVVTRIYPFKYVEESDDEPEQLITIGSVNDGNDYIDSPLINSYSQVFYEPLDLSDEESIETPQDLYDASKNFFNNESPDKPTIEMEVEFEPLWETEEYKDVAALELVGMGDTVTTRHGKFDIDVEAIVNRIEYDSIARKNLAVDLGSVKANLTSSVNDVHDRINEVDRKTERAVKSADGKNTNYYGPDEPSNPKKGDLWFRIVDGEYTRTYRFDGTEWQLIMNMDNQEAKELAAEAKSNAQDAVNRANEAVESASEAFEKADSLNEVVNENTGEISTIKQLAEGLQTKVSNNEDDISTVTQLANSLVSRVEGLAGKNLISHDPNNWYFFIRSLFLKDPMKVEPNETYTFTNYSNFDFDEVKLILFDGDKEATNEIILDDDEENINFTTEDNELYLNFSILGDASEEKLGTDIKFKLEKGESSTPWTSYEDDIYSQYSQLNNAINLRVEKGDIINQINVSDENILISGQKLILDGDTTIDGSFKVSDANIKSLDAGKITTGTLDAADVSIINLDVNQLTGNIATFVQKEWNDINSEVQITGRGLLTYNGSTLTSELNRWGHTFYSEGVEIGRIGTSSWSRDPGYKGLSFQLDSDADYMAWIHLEKPSDTYYTTQLAWHKNRGKDLKGFNFSDHVVVKPGSNFYVRTISTMGEPIVGGGYTNNRHMQFENYTWDGTEGVAFMRGSSGDGAALFLSSSVATLIDSGNAYIEVGRDGNGNYVQSIDVYNRTYTSTSQMMRVTQSGVLGRSTSSRRYKLLEKEIDLQYAKKLLKINAKSWFDKQSCEDYAHTLNTNEETEKESVARIGGVIAEDVHDVGLNRYVNYDDQDRPDGLHSSLWTLLIPISKDHENKIITLTDRVKDLDLNIKSVYDELKEENNQLKKRVKHLEDKLEVA